MWTKSTHALTVLTILLLVTHTYHALKKISFFNLTSPTHWWCFHYETYSGISQYRTPLYYMYTYKLYSKWMLLTERRRFTTLLMFVISGHVGHLYTYFRRWNIWPVVWENTNESSHTLFRWHVLYFPIPHSNEHRLRIVRLIVDSKEYKTASN